MKEIIKLENVVKMTRGNRRAVNGVSFRICEKERVAVCGPPDSGKNTLMRLIAGMEAPSDGKIFVLGQDVRKMSADQAASFRNRNIGIVRHNPGFMERLNVSENVSLPLAVQGMPLDKRRNTAKELLKVLGISHIAHAYPAQLSAYEMRKASIARALMAQPKILMMYEAAAGLSEKETKEFAGTVNAISKYGDYTVLSFGVMPINDLRTDRTIMQNYGKIREDKR